MLLQQSAKGESPELVIEAVPSLHSVQQVPCHRPSEAPVNAPTMELSLVKRLRSLACPPSWTRRASRRQVRRWAVSKRVGNDSAPEGVINVATAGRAVPGSG